MPNCSKTVEGSNFELYVFDRHKTCLINFIPFCDRENNTETGSPIHSLVDTVCERGLSSLRFSRIAMNHWKDSWGHENLLIYDNLLCTNCTRGACVTKVRAKTEINRVYRFEICSFANFTSFCVAYLFLT